jgi:hypothetical protein
VVEKEREKDLGKVVTGGGEGTEKANHRQHGGHGEKQTTEDTEDTEMGKEGADRLGRPYMAWHWVEHRAVGKGCPGRLESLPHIGHDTEGTEKANHRGHGGHGDGERGGGSRWSARSCGPDGVDTPVQVGIVWLCRRDRRHGKPGGLLHAGIRCGKQDCLLHGGTGVASLAACSTGNAGRRQQCLPHKRRRQAWRAARRKQPAPQRGRAATKQAWRLWSRRQPAPVAA